MSSSKLSSKSPSSKRGCANQVTPRDRALTSNSNGFSPELWGPSMWFMVHLVAATYPEQPTARDREHYAAFFKSLQHVLPCTGCRKGYEIIISTEPTQLTSRVFNSRPALFKWTVDVHNRVNAKLHKRVDANWRAWYKKYDKFR